MSPRSELAISTTRKGWWPPDKLTNIALENQWLEDVYFLIEIVFRGRVNFREGNLLDWISYLIDSESLLLMDRIRLCNMWWLRWIGIWHTHFQGFTICSTCESYPGLDAAHRRFVRCPWNLLFYWIGIGVSSIGTVHPHNGIANMKDHESMYSQLSWPFSLATRIL